MKNEVILDAIGKISEELIEDAAITARSKRISFPRKTIFASAACFCLLLTAAFAMAHFLQRNPAGTLPGFTTPSSPTTQGIPDDYVPFLSAYDVAGVLASFSDRNETNAYTVVAFPEGYLANISGIPSGNSVHLYNYLTAGIAPDLNSIQSFSNTVFASLEKTLAVTIPEAQFVKQDSHDGFFQYSSFVETGNYTIITEQYSLTERIAVLGISNAASSTIIMNQVAVKIDPMMSDEEMMQHFKPAAQQINAAFGTSFHDMSVVKAFNESSPSRINYVTIFLYNKENEPSDKIGDIPASDYIMIEFFVEQKDAEADAGLISYVHYRVPVEERMVQLREEPLLTLAQAEELLEKGYVFGGHSCSLCMQAQEKLDFSEYDYVGFEYVMGEADSEGVRLYVPFYTFYKKLESAPNCNERYAKTYVCATPVTDIESYFEMQAANHS